MGSRYIEIMFWSHQCFFEGLQSVSRYSVQENPIVEVGWISEMYEHSSYAT